VPFAAAASSTVVSRQPPGGRLLPSAARRQGTRRQGLRDSRRRWADSSILGLADLRGHLAKGPGACSGRGCHARGRGQKLCGGEPRPIRPHYLAATKSSCLSRPQRVSSSGSVSDRRGLGPAGASSGCRCGLSAVRRSGVRSPRGHEANQDLYASTGRTLTTGAPWGLGGEQPRPRARL